MTRKKIGVKSYRILKIHFFEQVVLFPTHPLPKGQRTSVKGNKKKKTVELLSNMQGRESTTLSN